MDSQVDHEFAEVVSKVRDFRIPGGESYRDLSERVFAFVAELPPGRHLLFVHGGVIRVLTQDLGVDRFVPTGSVVGLDWSARRLLFVHEPEASESLATSGPDAPDAL